MTRRPLIFRRRSWQPGRAGTGYFKYPVLEGPFFDLYLLRYPEGSHIHEHKDPLSLEALFASPLWWTPRHFRLNVVLKRAMEGGEFVCESVIFRTKHLAFFRPDKYLHQVTKVLRGTRYVLSFGVGI